MEYNSTYKPNQTKDSSIMYRSIKRTPERKRRIIVTDNGLKKSLEEIENVISHHKRSYQHEQYSEPRYYKNSVTKSFLGHQKFSGLSGGKGAVGDLYIPATIKSNKKARNLQNQSKMYCINIKNDSATHSQEADFYYNGLSQQNNRFTNNSALSLTIDNQVGYSYELNVLKSFRDRTIDSHLYILSRCIECMPYTMPILLALELDNPPVLNQILTDSSSKQSFISSVELPSGIKSLIQINDPHFSCYICGLEFAIMEFGVERIYYLLFITTQLYLTEDYNNTNIREKVERSLITQTTHIAHALINFNLCVGTNKRNDLSKSFEI